MTNTYYQLIYHLVWSTKERRPFITTEFRQRLYEYRGGIFRELDCTAIAIGGVSDHVHVCVEISPTKALSEILRAVKMSTSKWIRQNFDVGRDFEWQIGYGAFSVSTSNKEAVLNYIKNQEAHHKKYDFREEFLSLLRNHQIPYEEKYLWK